jgi:hypothetical protein
LQKDGAWNKKPSEIEQSLSFSLPERKFEEFLDVTRMLVPKLVDQASS